MSRDKKPKVAVLILGYKDKINLREAFDSVLNQKYSNFETIYIDNDSDDGSVEFAKKEYIKKIKIIENEINLGYAGAYKNVIKDVFSDDIDAVVLLNPDVIVAEGWLQALVNTAYSDEKIAIVQSKIFLFNEGKTDLLNTDGNRINYLGIGFCGNYGEKDSFNQDREITYASGAGLLLKRDHYFSIGELDDNFFAYVEDQDLSWRAWMMGYKVMLSSESKMWHKYKYEKTQRNSDKFFLLERNRLYFIFKNYSLMTILLITPFAIIVEFSMIVYSILNGYFIKKIRSYISFVDNFGTIIEERKIVQERRVLSDKEMFKMLSQDINFSEIDGISLKIFNIFSKVSYTIIKVLI